MAIIPEEQLKQQEEMGTQYRRDSEGNVLGIKMRFLPDWYDNFTECLKDNQRQRQVLLWKQEGKNEQGQTPAQEADFKKRQKIAEQRKRQAELAVEMAEQSQVDLKR